MAADGWDGFHQTTISRIEKGQRPVRLAEARALAKVLESQVGLMMAPPESEILESLANNIGLMRLARRRIWAQLEEMNEVNFILKTLMDDVERIPREQWERLGLWEDVAAMVVPASHMQNWSAASLIAEALEGPHGVDPEA
ncbi:transcriptional regulator with XRE-family HTH domain [Pseudarthrobacter sp. W1I19]|nr:transcriptional regulator with XRE-family HTH domain [Pseudarthrobacter sp. W1I19]